MNRNLISPLKILLLGIFALFFGCTKDIYEDSIQPNQDYYVKTIDFDEFKKNCSGFQKYKGIEDVKARAKTSRVAIDSIYGFAVKTDEAKYIKDGDYDSYTFEIFWPGSDNKTLSNLLFSKNKDGGYDAYVVAYDFPKGALAGMTVEEITTKDAKFYYIDTESASERIPIEGCVFWYEQKCTPPRDGNNDGGSIDPECHWVRMQICGHQAGGDFPDGWNDDSGGSTPPGGNQGGNTSNPPSGSIGGNGAPTHITTPTICTGCPDFNDEDMHCNQLKFALERDAENKGLKPNLKPQIKWLQGKVDEKLEYGVEIKKSVNFDGDMVYTPTQKTSASNFEIELEQQSYMVGWLHSHPINGYGMFSFGDLKFLRDGYDMASDSRKQEVFTMIVCRDILDPTKTNTYALKIDDFAKFSEKVDAVWNHSKYLGKTDKQKRELIHQAQSEIYARSNNQLEKSFLQQFSGFGISLYKANSNLTNWSKLDLSATPNTPLIVIETPCN